MLFSKGVVMLKDEVPASRRNFIKLALGAGGTMAAMHTLGVSLFAEPVGKSGSYLKMTKLPYAQNALEPYISRNTIERHYYEHHLAYYKQLTGYIKVNPKYDNIPLEKLIDKTRGGILLEDALFNFGVLLWNHNFYWKSMKKGGGIIKNASDSDLTKIVIKTYGSIKKFKEKFIEKSMELGIGWVWLIKEGKDSVSLLRTDYGNTISLSKVKPLATIDLWEHAYYTDYGHERKKYVNNYLDHLVNWKFAEKNFKE